MKTLADFKRALTIGSVWYRKHVNESEFVKRTVSKLHSTHVYVIDDEKGKEVRLDFPAASEFEINSNGEAEIYYPANPQWNEPRRLILTYRKDS